MPEGPAKQQTDAQVNGLRRMLEYGRLPPDQFKRRWKRILLAIAVALSIWGGTR